MEVGELGCEDGVGDCDCGSDFCVWVICWWKVGLVREKRWVNY